MIFQASEKSARKETLTNQERETIGWLNKMTDKQIYGMSRTDAKNIELTKNVIEKSNPLAIAKIAIERYDNIFNLPHYDAISKKKMDDITKSYEEIRKRGWADTERAAAQVVPQKKESATAISNLMVKPKDTGALVDAYKFLHEYPAGANVNESEYLIRNPSATDIDKVNYLLETKYSMLKSQGKDKEADRLYENYFNLMRGKKKTA
jgi:hypothetical protein